MRCLSAEEKKWEPREVSIVKRACQTHNLVYILATPILVSPEVKVTVMDTTEVSIGAQQRTILCHQSGQA